MCFAPGELHCSGVCVSFIFAGRNEKEGKALEEEVNKSGPGSAFFVKCDVSKPEEVIKLVNVTVAKYGRIDCLINNAVRNEPSPSSPVARHLRVCPDSTLGLASSPQAYR